MIGIIIGVYIACALTGLPLEMKYFGTTDLKKWEKLPLLGGVFGALLIGMPLFFICIRPFYTRQALTDFIIQTGGSVEGSYGLGRILNKYGWFCFNLFYPEKKQKDEKI